MSKTQVSPGSDLLVTRLDRAYQGAEREVVKVDGSTGDYTVKNPAGSTVLRLDGATGVLSVNGQVSVAASGASLIYVSTTGNDANPGTSALPLLTPRAAWTKATSQWWSGRSQIIFAAGSYTLDAPSGFSYASAAGSKGAGSPIALIGGYEDAGQGVRTADATSASGLSYTDSTLAMTINQYVGYMIKCVTGVNAGRMALIRSNTATAVTLQIKFPNANTSGDTFQILKPSVTFNIPNNTGVVFGHNNDYIAFKGIKFVYGNSSSSLIFVDYTHAACEGVQIVGTGGANLIVNTLAVLQDPTTGPWAQDLTNSPFSSLRTAGISFSNVSLLMGHQALLAGAHVFSTVNQSCLFPCARLELANPISFSSSFTVSNNSYLQIFDRNATLLPGALSAPGTSSTSPINVSTGSYADITQLDCQNMTGPCIKVDDMSRAKLNTVTGTTGNTDVGLQVTNMSQIRQLSCTVTGVTGDTRVNATLKVYGDLPFTDTDTLNRIQ